MKYFLATGMLKQLDRDGKQMKDGNGVPFPDMPWSHPIKSDDDATPSVASQHALMSPRVICDVVIREITEEEFSRS
jgi:hypothetical protein